MSDFMKNMLDGMGNVLEVYRGAPYIFPKKGDTCQDNRALSNDMKRIGSDMRAVLKKEGEYGETYQS